MRSGSDFTFALIVISVSYTHLTHELLELSDAEEKAGVQLFGREPQILADTARKICDLLGERLFIIDVNMGCPAPKIVNNGEGSALMREPALAARIVSALKKAVPVPVSVKFRACLLYTSKENKK